MEKNFNADDVYEFLKSIITIGNVHYIDNQHVIRCTKDDTPKGVRLNSGKDGNKVIALYKENMEMDPTKVLLNPFVDLLGKFPEKDWFFGYMSVLPGTLLKLTIQGMCKHAVDNEKDAGFKAAKTLAKFIDRIDAKFLTELEKIRAVDIAIIAYGQQEQTAQLISALWEEEFETKMKSKLRKSSLLLIRDMVSTLLDVKQPEEIVYKATLIGCPQMDAMSHVFVDTIGRFSDSIEHFMGTKVDIEGLRRHLDNLEAYHRAMQWLTSSAVSPMHKESTKASTVSEATSPFGPSSVGHVTKISGTLPTATITPTITQIAPAAPGGLRAREDNEGEPRSSVASALSKGAGTVVLPQFHTPAPTSFAAAPVLNPGMMAAPMYTPMTPMMPGSMPMPMLAPNMGYPNRTMLSMPMAPTSLI